MDDLLMIFKFILNNVYLLNYNKETLINWKLSYHSVYINCLL